MEWVVKLTKHKNQYRITIPRELIVKIGYENVEVVRLKNILPSTILIEEYYGKSKEKGNLPEDKA